MTQSNGSRVPAAAVRIVSLWILVGALYKLFQGTPNDLPPPVLEFLPNLDPGLKLHLAIAIELAVVVLAWVTPRIAWPLVVAQFAVFIGILVVLLARGAESCGCFGSKVTMPPAAMLAIDGACLVGLLATRPWKTFGPSKPRLGLALPLAAAVMALPWFVIRDQVEVAPRPPSVGQNGSPGDPLTAPAKSEFRLPSPLPRFAVLSPLKQKWVGKHIRDTELGLWVDVDLFPQDATWLIYRLTCEHCRDHFIKLNAEFDPANPKLYVLVRIPEVDDEKNRQVDVFPEHFPEEAVLPGGMEWFMQTPWTIEIEGGIVKRAYRDEGEEEDSAK